MALGQPLARGSNEITWTQSPFRLSPFPSSLALFVDVRCSLMPARPPGTPSLCPHSSSPVGKEVCLSSTHS